MKLLQINGGLFGSTGKIMFSIERKAKNNDFDVLCCSPITEKKTSDRVYYEIESFYTRKINGFFEYVFGLNSILAKKPTRKLIKVIEKYNPDIIQLHTIHGSYLNLKTLFAFFKKTKYKIVWTFHDCWPFTGRCPHFIMAECEKWKTGCHDCPYPKNYYPRSLVDRTKKMWNLKKELFTGVKNMSIITPSQWLSDLVKESFLNEYPIKVINNGIDLTLFKPTESNFKKAHDLNGKYILLGIADSWGARKGLDVFIELSKRLPQEYQIVLVGTNGDIDKQLPPNIISIHRTQNQTQLVEIYSSSDLFVNPTREDNFPTVNIESLACGTPVLTFQTGGSPEIIDETCGSVVECEDIDALEKEIKRICETQPYTREACLKRAKAFDMNDKFQEYVELYKAIVEKEQR